MSALRLTLPDRVAGMKQLTFRYPRIDPEASRRS